jgi:hypothetical protein
VPEKLPILYFRRRGSLSEIRLVSPMHRVPVVSVVLPVFNAEPYLNEALASILEQSLTNFELIAINDGSTDDSGRILTEHAARDSRIHVVSRENRGLSRSLNEGLEAARANYVAIMNADDVAIPDRLSNQAAFLDAHPSVAAVGGQVRLMLADGKVGPATRLPQTPAAIRRFLKRMSPFAHPAVMLRRQAALAAGGYRPQIQPAEDLDLWLRLAERHDLANLPDVVLHYRLHAGQATARAFEAVAVATLVAKAATRIRRAGGSDPVEGRSQIDRPFAEQLGIAPREIAENAIKAALGRSESVLSCGASPAVAWQPLQVIQDGTVIASDRSFLNATNRWFAGRVLASEGHFLQALPDFVSAARAVPYFRCRLAAALYRRIIAIFIEG